jgi:hypothetical protein
LARVLLKNVTKRFGNVIAVNSSSIEVEDIELLFGWVLLAAEKTLYLLVTPEEIKNGKKGKEHF